MQKNIEVQELVKRAAAEAGNLSESSGEVAHYVIWSYQPFFYAVKQRLKLYQFFA